MLERHFISFSRPRPGLILGQTFWRPHYPRLAGARLEAPMGRSALDSASCARRGQLQRRPGETASRSRSMQRLAQARSKMRSWLGDALAELKA